MAAKVIAISIPESMHIYVQGRASASEFASVSEYFRELIRNDQQLMLQRVQQRAAFERSSLASTARRHDPHYGERHR